VLAFVALVTMDGPEQEHEDLDCDDHLKHRKKKNKVSVWKMLSIPTVWFSFSAFIVATMCNGFLSINLEPQVWPSLLPLFHHLHQVLRNFSLTPFYIGIFFGLKDGANRLARSPVSFICMTHLLPPSPMWGWLCDRNRTSVKPFLIIGSLLVAVSFFLLGAGSMFGSTIQLTLPILVVALCFNGAGIGGQQVEPPALQPMPPTRWPGWWTPCTRPRPPATLTTRRPT
jgi:hypothetical protein